MVQPSFRLPSSGSIKPVSLPVLSYLMWTQHLPVTNLQQIDREARKIVVSNGGKHPLGSTALCYLSREQGRARPEIGGGGVQGHQDQRRT